MYCCQSNRLTGVQLRNSLDTFRYVRAHSISYIKCVKHEKYFLVDSTIWSLITLCNYALFLI